MVFTVRLLSPGALVVMAYHRNVSAMTRAGGTPDDWIPDDWTRPEFSEAAGAQTARDTVEMWLVSCRAGLDLAAKVMEGGSGTAAELLLSHWLDEVLYGCRKFEFPQEEWAGIQLVADSMARADFCRMDFGAVAARVREVDGGG